MNQEDLLKLLTDSESERVEWKESDKAKDKICQAICAFCNDLPNHDQPGYVVVGLNDAGQPTGQSITDQLLQNLGSIRSDGNIQPLPSIAVEKMKIGDRDVAVITVHPSDFPPVRYKGTVWIRVGPRRGTATRDEERRLTEKRQSRDLPYDLHPISHASLEDLDLKRFNEEYLPQAISREALEANERTTAERLASLRLLSGDGSETPTVAGILVLGKRPFDNIASGYVQFRRVEGINHLDPTRNSKEISGTISDILRLMEEIFDANNQIELKIEKGARHKTRPLYPIEAFRQIFRNAVLHRNYQGTNSPIRVTWYEDRIEIFSPGGPYGHVTKEDFEVSGSTDYRNPTLAESMKAMGYIEKFGFGIPLARRALESNGNPPLEFQIEDSHVLAILRKLP